MQDVDFGLHKLHHDGKIVCKKLWLVVKHFTSERKFDRCFPTAFLYSTPQDGQGPNWLPDI